MKAVLGDLEVAPFSQPGWRHLPPWSYETMKQLSVRNQFSLSLSLGFFPSWLGHTQCPLSADGMMSLCCFDISRQDPQFYRNTDSRHGEISWVLNMHPAHSTTDCISSPSPSSATYGGVTVKISLLTGSVICFLSLFSLCKILAPCTMSSISRCKLNMPSHDSVSEQNCSRLSFCKRVHGKKLKRKFRWLCASAVFPSFSPTYHFSPKFVAQASSQLSYQWSFIPSAFAQI